MPTASTSIEPIEGPNYDGVRAEVTVLRDGVPIAVLHPEKRNYWVQRSTHDRGRHRQPLEHGSVRGAGRGPRRGPLEHARAAAAAHRLRLAGGRAHGPGRRARRHATAVIGRAQLAARSRRSAGADRRPRPREPIPDSRRGVPRARRRVVRRRGAFAEQEHHAVGACWASRRRLSSCRCSASPARKLTTRSWRAGPGC